MQESGQSETWFEGELFRSGLEARWALFYQEMALIWTHKPDPVDFESESFQPDFFLRQGLWTIVKGTFPTGEEKDKARSLAERSGYPVYFVYGEIPHPDPNDEAWYTASALAFFSDGTMDEAYWWCACPICHSAGIQFEGRAANLPCECMKGADPEWDPSHCHSERILRAYRNARKAEVTAGAEDGHDVLKKRIWFPFDWE